MSRSGITYCCVVWSLVSSATAFAQSIDPSGASLALHRPFMLRLPVRTDDPEATPGRRLKACVEADFQSGATLLFSDQMRVTLQPAPRPGWQWLVFEHPHVVKEPALFAHVVLRCPAHFEREFVVQAGLVDEAPPVAPSVRATSTAPLPRSSETGAPRSRSRSAERPASAVPAPAPIAALPPAAPPEHIDETGRLKAEVAALRAALAAAQRAGATAGPMASPSVSGSVDEGDRNMRLSPVLLLLAATFAALLPALRWWRLRTRLPTLHTMEIAEPPPAAAAPPATRTMPAIHVVLEGRPEMPDLIPPNTIMPGTPSLEDRDAARFTSQLEGLVADGYLGVAVSLLEKSLEATSARNPWLMLQLLGLYEQTGEASKGAQLIGQLQTLYRVHLPTLGGVVQAGRALLELPGLLAEVQRAWTSPDLLEVLQDLIFGNTGPAWDLATFQDLLMLHAVAAVRPTLDLPPAPASCKPFEPVLEWTVHDDH